MGASGCIADAADRMGAVAPVASVSPAFARWTTSLTSTSNSPSSTRQAFDGAALVSFEIQHAARFRLHVVPLQPLHRLDPADDGEAHLAVVGEEDRRVGLRGFLDEGLFLAGREDALDRDVESLAQAPDGGERRVGLVALDLADDRLRDPGLLGQFREDRLYAFLSRWTVLPS